MGGGGGEYWLIRGVEKKGGGVGERKYWLIRGVGGGRGWEWEKENTG